MTSDAERLDSADAHARSTALDPARSFIVAAPAGSGKTELLIQRFLRLLATVEQPEEVVAITFTRKAAAEMRRRVLNALAADADGTPATSEQGAATLALAHAVASRAAQRDWRLADDPQRLRIDTLDALNAHLARQLPILAGGVAAARIVEDARALYADAARRTVAQLGPSEVGAAVRRVLRALDGNVPRLAGMLAELLPRREQWLAHLANGDGAALRAQLEGALARLVVDELGALAAFSAPPLRGELDAVLAHAAECSEEAAVRDTLREPPAARSAPRGAPRAAPPDTPRTLARWRAVAEILLTREGTWRKQLPKKHGFGADRPEGRKRLTALLAKLAAEHDELRAPLASAAVLPDPHYSDEQWTTLVALRVVLLHLTAELKVLFAEQASVDFPELALGARHALGRVDAPSDLLLALDRRIRHLLIDEFQDTSRAQLDLIATLTSGWEAGDGRTVFLVGDPMQSIYRFRNAEMGLFLRAQRHGLGAIPLTSLRLTRNFRSAPAIVNWANAAFARVFPPRDDLAAGAAAFHPSVAACAPDAQAFVRVHALRDAAADAEVERALAVIGAERERARDQSIAVLVQGRSHLAGLRERLAARGWPAHTVDIEGLADWQVAHDVVGLARALVHPADRIAWLGVLRAPWCGLTWHDLHALASEERARTVSDLLDDPAVLARLTADGRARATAARDVLAAAFAGRARQPFAAWLAATWRALGGHECVTDEEGVVVEQVLALLERSSRRGDFDDPATLDALLEQAQPQAEPPRGQGIEIMTIHRAKGLEFDTVVLLGIGREPRPEEPRALHWLERTAADGSDDLLVAPLTTSEDERLLKFVRRNERQRDLAERGRVLYVAATRARARLHIIGQLANGQPRPRSLLAHLWPVVAAEFAAAEALEPPREADGAASDVAARVIHAVLERRPEPPAAAPLTLTAPPSAPAAARPEFAWARRSAAHIGTVVHRLLRTIAATGADAWDETRVWSLAPSIRRELALLGVDTEELTRAAERVATAVARVLGDPQGRFVLERHAEAQSELNVTLRTAEGLEHVRLDRTFVAEGKRWIVDFKTSSHEGGDPQSFLASEVERYRAQLERYARAMALIDSRPIEIALYFPLLRALKTWPAL